MPGRKEKPQEKLRTLLSGLKPTPLSKATRAAGAAQGRKQQNILSPFEKHHYMSEKQEVRAEAKQGTAQQLQMVFTYMEWMEEAPRWAAQTTCQQLPAAGSSGSHHGADQVQPCSTTPTAPQTSHQQICAGGMGHQLPRVPRHHAAQNLSSRSLLM